MSTTTIDSTTGRGIRSVTAYLAVRPAIELIEFVKQAFGARELLRTTGTGGGTHAEVQIGDTKVMIGGGGAWGGTPTPTALHLYVPDADRVYQAALAAGAVSLRSPVDQPYGDREACVRDLAGNHWYIATHQEGSHVPEGLTAVTPYLHPRGAPELIDFLKRAFAAEEMAVHRGPRARSSTRRSASAARSSRWARLTTSGNRCPRCSICTSMTWMPVSPGSRRRRDIDGNTDLAALWRAACRGARRVRQPVVPGRAGGVSEQGERPAQASQCPRAAVAGEPFRKSFSSSARERARSSSVRLIRLISSW